MKNYELMTIANVDLGDEKAKSLSKKIQEIITEQGGVVSKTDFWGKRKFSYEIKHKKEGYYDVLYFELDPKKAPVLEAKLNLLDGLLRYLVTVK